jgi:hypothetical protein
VHIDRDDLSAKLWLVPVALAQNLGFSRRELADIERVVSQHQQVFLEAWNEFFGT